MKISASTTIGIHQGKMTITFTFHSQGNITASIIRDRLIHNQHYNNHPIPNNFIFILYNLNMDSSAVDLLNQITQEEDVLVKAKLIKRLMSEHSIRLYEAANYLQVKPSYLSNILRLLKLPELVKDGYYAKIISAAHLIILSRLNDEDVVSAYEEVLANNFTTIQTQNLVREKLYKIKTKGEHISHKLKDELINTFKKIEPGLNVTIIQTQVQGKIILNLKGNKDKTKVFFEKLLKTINK